MLKIKLSKVGKTNRKVFRIVVSEKGKDPFGRHVDILGSYNPYSKELNIKAERVKYWLSKGAQATATVNNLLIEEKIITGEKLKASKKGKPNKKKQEKLNKKEKEEVKEEPKEEKEEVKEEPKEEKKEDIDKKA